MPVRYSSAEMALGSRGFSRAYAERSPPSTKEPCFLANVLALGGDRDVGQELNLSSSSMVGG
jgi:hypothetical protein